MELRTGEKEWCDCRLCCFVEMCVFLGKSMPRSLKPCPNLIRARCFQYWRSAVENHVDAEPASAFPARYLDSNWSTGASKQREAKLLNKADLTVGILGVRYHYVISE